MHGNGNGNTLIFTCVCKWRRTLSREKFQLIIWVRCLKFSCTAYNFIGEVEDTLNWLECSFFSFNCLEPIFKLEYISSYELYSVRYIRHWQRFRQFLQYFYSFFFCWLFLIQFIIIIIFLRWILPFLCFQYDHLNKCTWENRKEILLLCRRRANILSKWFILGWICFFFSCKLCFWKKGHLHLHWRRRE